MEHATVSGSERLYRAAAAFCFYFFAFCIGYVWRWWVKVGRHEPERRKGRTVIALVYGTLLPVLLLGVASVKFQVGILDLEPCDRFRGFAGLGLIVVAAGLVLALWLPGKVRAVIIVNALAMYLLVTAMSWRYSPHC
jgi:hypothetical protein